ncbi:Leucine efflux protein [Tepidimonas alkaliphilus]|uniref:Leucine efflux protein n=1 Tax=Tepidimonas alkaliphilus TaxID=2588942 RepID=A0A554WAB8_9BURK|nr:leucine efflux protein LeuE [Tepidimonas alkaliphilus]TSE20502.1 Leucine efflux protein [Tepidimonas alkaliphilus]
MLGITDLTTFIVGTIVIVLLPGPNSMYVLSVASREGVLRGYQAACGVFVGDTILMALSAAGLASVLAAHPWLFMAVKYAGAAYLGWIGLNLLRAAWRGWRRGAPQRLEAEAPPPAAAGGGRPFRRALSISLLNPKAIFFFISFFVQFVDPAYPWPALSFVALGAIVQVCSALYLSALIFAGDRLAQAFRAQRHLAAALNAAVGALFIGFGLRLARASAP